MGVQLAAVLTRTPDQIAADDALTAAIEAVQRAYDNDVQGVLTKYVVLTQRQGWHDDGTTWTTSASLPRDDSVPVSDLLGMVEFASTVYRHDITHFADDD